MAGSPDPLDDIRKRLSAVESRLASYEQASGLFCTDAELDGRNGNSKINFDPKRWRGPSCKGRVMSECSPAFLDEYAEAMTWMAANPKPGREKYAKYNVLDAKRARSWARRLRAGWDAPRSDGFEAPTAMEAPGGMDAPESYGAGDDGFDPEEIPFG
jgi:hypothetical protein